MANKYELTFKNSTAEPHYFGVYQKFPTDRLESIAWQVIGLPPGGIGQVAWSLDYSVAIANWQHGRRAPGQYTQLQMVPAQLGHNFEVSTSQEAPDIPQISLTTASTEQPQSKNIITILNNTNHKLTIGFAIDGSLVATEVIAGGETGTFEPHTTYQVACFRRIKKGHPVGMDIQLGPMEVNFDGSFMYYVVEATIIDGGKKTLKVFPYDDDIDIADLPELSSMI